MKTIVLLLALSWAFAPPLRGQIFPGRNWEMRSPEAAGLTKEKLEALSAWVGGRGCVVRHGCMVFTWGDPQISSDVASAFKPLLSTLLFMAVQEGKLSSVDDRVSDFEPRLQALNDGKDAGITWRHLASQLSGYGLTEAPGRAYSYNDYALTLYYDTLTQRVFGTNGTAVLQTRLAEPLQFEDRFTFDAFGPKDRPGRLALSVRDFARFGVLILRQGKWNDRQLIKPELIQMAISSPLSPDTPLTRGEKAEMVPGQRTMGGTRNITPVGPGYTRGELSEYLNTVGVDFISPHRPRTPASAAQTQGKTPEYLSWMKELGRVAPVHYQEPFRRGYGPWQPAAEAFLADARHARESGAAGWCFHNGDERGKTDGQPRRSFDLRETRLFDQFDEQERQVIRDLEEFFTPAAR